MRLRLRSTKLGKVRFVSHRDGARLWERALRRVALPVAYTEGFTPRPKLSFGLALPTGAESVAEYIDVDLDTQVDPDDDLAARLSDVLPVGIDVTGFAIHTGTTSLQDEVTSTTWELTVPGVDGTRLADAAERLLATDELLVERERKGRRSIDDVRPLICHLAPDVSGTRLVAELATVGRALRPSELVGAAFAGIDPVDVRVLRTHQWIEHDGGRREVLPARTPTNGLADRRRPDDARDTARRKDLPRHDGPFGHERLQQLRQQQLGQQQ